MLGAITTSGQVAEALHCRFEVPDGGETIPLAGFAVVTGVFSVVGIVTRRRDMDPERLPVAESAEATTAPEQVQDAWASIPPPSWPPETSQWPQHLSMSFKAASDADH